jgi:hypothetical protein
MEISSMGPFITFFIHTDVGTVKAVGISFRVTPSGCVEVLDGCNNVISCHTVIGESLEINWKVGK